MIKVICIKESISAFNDSKYEDRYNIIFKDRMYYAKKLYENRFVLIEIYDSYLEFIGWFNSDSFITSAEFREERINKILE